MKPVIFGFVAAGLFAGSVAVAQGAPVRDVGEFDPALCTQNSAVNEVVLGQWAAASEDDVAQAALLRSALAENPWNAVCLMQQADNQGTQIDLLQDLIDVLNEEGEQNAPVVAALMEAYGELLAQVVADVQPAAGPGGPQFGPTGSEPGENPSQLNTPTDDGDEASPASVPVF